MTDVNKAIKPVESLTIAPINEGSVFKANVPIIFRIGASNMNMWLTNSSYLTFDLVADAVANCFPDEDYTYYPSYIRNASNIFGQIEVLYGGKTIYTQTDNIEQNTLRQLSYGESYLKANYATFTTRKMVIDGDAYLALQNTRAGAKGAGATNRLETTIHNVMIPINQLLPMFMDCGSDGFPVRCLKNQIEIRLTMSEPYRYLVDWDGATKDFSHKFERDSNDEVEKKITERFPSTSIHLENVKLYCSHYLPSESYAAQIDAKCLNSPDGMTWGFIRHEIAKRVVTQINATNNLPFTATTENTQSLMLYCHRTGYSSSLMYRPNINSLYIKFGSNQLPFQPIPGNTMTSPFEYIFPTDDVLNALDTYYSETNNDFNTSYKYTIDPGQNAGGYRNNIPVPESSFVLMGCNYVSDPSALGSQSSMWNSQYQATFNAPYNDKSSTNGITFILAVESKWGLYLQNGNLDTVNI